MNSLLRLPTVMSSMGLSRASIYLRVKERLITTPIKIGKRAISWPCYEIEAINNFRIAGKSEAEIRELVAKLEQQRAAMA
jgi:prophage regulatory protein